MPGYIETVPAERLKVGDVFSTDGTIVQHVEKTLSGVYVEGVCHGVAKDATLDPAFPCPLWREESLPTASERIRAAREEG